MDLIKQSVKSIDGKIEVTFDEPEESHLNWRQHSKVFDIWLFKK